MRKLLYIALCLLVTLVACKQKETVKPDASESKEAKALLQGIWLDEESENVVFKVEGDTIFYPDSVSQPAFFRVISDTLVIGEQASKYPLVKQTAHVFWFQNPNGDTIRLVKSEELEDSLVFSDSHPEVLTMAEVTKHDTVISYGKERYHCYIAVNPTQNKIVSSTYDDSGVEVNNVYYDNIIRLSVFHGNTCLFGKSYQKKEFMRFVPEDFLNQAILSNAEFDHADEDGIHFNATLCTPNAASCYLVEIVVSYKGRTSMNLLEN